MQRPKPPPFEGLGRKVVTGIHSQILSGPGGNLLCATVSSKSDATVAATLLKRHGFGATFFITEGFDFATNKRNDMTWDEIAQFHRDGFEIGNHARDHKAPDAKDPKATIEQLEAIDSRCFAHGIPRPVSFAYPGNSRDRDVLPLLCGRGIVFAHRGGSPEYPYDVLGV